MTIWSPEKEALPRARMEALQLERLRATVARVLASVPPLGDRLRAAASASRRTYFVERERRIRTEGFSEVQNGCLSGAGAGSIRAESGQPGNLTKVTRSGSFPEN